MIDDEPLTDDQLIVKHLILAIQKLDMVLTGLADICEEIKKRGPRRVDSGTTKEDGC